MYVLDRTLSPGQLKDWGSRDQEEWKGSGNKDRLWHSPCAFHVEKLLATLVTCGDIAGFLPTAPGLIFLSQDNEKNALMVIVHVSCTEPHSTTF